MTASEILNALVREETTLLARITKRQEEIDADKARVKQIDAIISGVKLGQDIASAAVESAVAAAAEPTGVDINLQAADETDVLEPTAGALQDGDPSVPVTKEA